MLKKLTTIFTTLHILIIIQQIIGEEQYDLSSPNTVCNEESKHSEKYSSITNNIIVLTVATSKTDGYKRYIRSAQQYGIEPITLGLGEEWKGGNVKYTTGGGFKINLLKDAVKTYKDDKDKIILFTDGYDVIFLSDLKTIINKFKETESRVLFSAEGALWPDKTLQSEYPLPLKGKRYLNSGIFMAYAPELWEILNDKELADDDDDQLFYTQIYLNESKREKLNLKLDHTSEIFQNLYGAHNDLEMQYDESETYLENVAYKTRPSILHGNGISKITFNSLSNYLGRVWSPEKGCLACKDDVVDLSEVPNEKLPTIVLGIMIPLATPFLEECLEKIALLNYPKNKIHLFIYNSQTYHTKHIEDFLNNYEAEYAGVKQIKPEDKTSEATARNLALDHCINKKCDAYFNVDSVVRLDNADTLKLLLEQNRRVVAPMLTRPGKAWSNFWGALTDAGFYARSADYMDIVHNERRGLWNVPFITNCYLLNATVLQEYDHHKIHYGIDGNIDPDMAFCKALRDLDVFMYVSNLHDFGHLVNPETYDITKTAPDMYQIFENVDEWQRKYIHELYAENFNPEKKPLQPCPDVYRFPIVSPSFCNDLIDMMEGFGKWSEGKNEDSRLEGGYEAVPTRDIHMNQVGWERHWLHFLKEYVRPLQEYVFTGYYHNPPRSLMNFVVRYRPDEQPSLRPHHDSSTYTINIALNTAGIDYTGGGCRFIRYNCSIVDTKPGWMLMHPGRLTHFHEGLRVTNGTRYIMIAFVDP